MKMDDILKKVAEMNGVTVEEVKSEIQKSIDEAAKNPSPAFKKSFGDRVPSVEEFLEKTSNQVTKKMGN